MHQIIFDISPLTIVLLLLFCSVPSKKSLRLIIVLSKFFVCLFILIPYAPVNNFAVMLGLVLLG